MPSLIERIRQLQERQDTEEIHKRTKVESLELLLEQKRIELEEEIQTAAFPFISRFQTLGVFSALDDLIQTYKLAYRSDTYYEFSRDKVRNLVSPEITAEVEFNNSCRSSKNLRYYLNGDLDLLETYKIRKGGDLVRRVRRPQFFGTRLPDEKDERETVRTFFRKHVVSVKSVDCRLRWGHWDSSLGWGYNACRHGYREIYIRLGKRGEKFELDVNGDIIPEKEFSSERIMSSIANAYMTSGKSFVENDFSR